MKVDGKLIRGLRAYKVKNALKLGDRCGYWFAWVGETGSSGSVVAYSTGESRERVISFGALAGNCYPVPFKNLPASVKEALRAYLRQHNERKDNEKANYTRRKA